MNNIKFKRIHTYIHAYTLSGLSNFLSSYEKELNGIYFKSKENRGKDDVYNESILNPNLIKPLTNILLHIVDKFYMVDKNWENKGFMLYSQSSQDNESIFHHHQNDSSIVSTMYLNIPRVGDEGGLEFFFNSEDRKIIYPEEDDIYFFPSWSLHRPLAHKGDKIRHCINWGYNCSKRPIHKLTGDRW